MTEPLRVGVAGLGTVGASVIRILSRQDDALRSARAGRYASRRCRRASGRRTAASTSPATPGSTIPWRSPRSGEVDCVVELIGGAEGAAQGHGRGGDRGRQARRHRQQGAARQARRSRSPAPPRRRAWRSPSRRRSRAAFRSSRPCARRLPGNAISRVYGILNGTCNYILSRMELEGLTFADCLADAQRARLRRGRPDLRRRGLRHRPQARDPDEPRLRHRDRRRGDLRRGHLGDHAARPQDGRRNSATASSCSASPSARRPASSSACTRRWCRNPPPSRRSWA